MTPKKKYRPESKSIRHGMSLSKLPKSMGHIEVRTNLFRRQLEDETLEVKGRIDVVDAAHICTATRCERVARLCERWITLEADQMSHRDRLSYVKQVATASAMRDRSIEAIGIESAPDSQLLIPSLPTVDTSEPPPVESTSEPVITIEPQNGHPCGVKTP